MKIVLSVFLVNLLILHQILAVPVDDTTQKALIIPTETVNLTDTTNLINEADTSLGTSLIPETNANTLATTLEIISNENGTSDQATTSVSDVSDQATTNDNNASSDEATTVELATLDTNISTETSFNVTADSTIDVTTENDTLVVTTIATIYTDDIGNATGSDDIEEVTTLAPKPATTKGPTKLTVVLESPTLKVQRGQPIELVCNVQKADNTTIIYWIQEEPERRYAVVDSKAITVSGSQATLRVRITLDDPSKIGKYVCMAQDGKGNSHTGVLTMEEESRYYEPPQPVYPDAGSQAHQNFQYLRIAAPEMAEGDYVEIHCEGAAPEDEGRIQWYFNERLLNDENPLFPRGKTLHIRPISRNYLGNYRCSIPGGNYGDGNSILTFSKLPSHDVQPNYNEQPTYNQQPTYNEQPHYNQQPTYNEQPNYNQQPTYNEQPNYNQQPTYNEQPNYNQQPTYNEQPNYNQQPTYNEQPNYNQQPSYDVAPVFNPSSPLSIEEGTSRIIQAPSDYERAYWTRSDGQALPSDIYQIGNDLRITNARSDHSGTYNCDLYRQDGTHRQVSYEIQVQRAEAPQQQTGGLPKIIIQPQSIDLKEGQRMIVRYTIVSHEPIDIKWHKYTDQGYQELPAGFSAESDRLILHRATPDSAGIYQVTVRNSHGEVRQELRVNVQPRHQQHAGDHHQQQQHHDQQHQHHQEQQHQQPQQQHIEVTAQPGEVSIAPGERATVTCHVKGTEQYRVTWGKYAHDTSLPSFAHQQGNDVIIAPPADTPAEQMYLQCQVNVEGRSEPIIAYTPLTIRSVKRKRRNLRK